MTNIQKNKEAALKQLDIQYASADKAKTSFGYIGITFLTVLFGSIFGNDLIKLYIYHFNHLRDCYRNWCERIKHEGELEEEENKKEIILEMDQTFDDDLEEALEKVYFKLVRNNAKWRSNTETLKKTNNLFDFVSNNITDFNLGLLE